MSLYCSQVRTPGEKNRKRSISAVTPPRLAMTIMMPMRNSIREKQVAARSRDSRFFFTMSTARQPTSSPATNTMSMGYTPFRQSVLSLF